LASLGLVRRLPAPLQQAVIGGAERLRRFLEARAASPPEHAGLDQLPARTGRRYIGRRVAVAGLFGRRCGLQRGAWLMVLDLRARGIEVLALDLTRAIDFDPDLPTQATTDIAALEAWQPTDLVIHLNPPLFARAMKLLPPAILAGACVIGYWVWELDVVPADWGPYAEAADELWAPTPFVAEAMRLGLPDFPGPIAVVPHAVGRDPVAVLSPAARAGLRDKFGFSDRIFTVGTSFSFDSNYSRKNPCAAIDAFRLAFAAGEPARLILRCNDAARNARLFRHLASYAGGDPRILVWDNAMAGCAIGDFYGLLDLYLSLHRSEGYGLTLAEALQAGLPVLATGWWLAPDLAGHPRLRAVGYRLVVPLDPQGMYEACDGALWAEPDLAEAAACLQELRRTWLGMESGEAAHWPDRAT
jgi:glycosyltransferase involved in cell wall biosynthesis